MDYVMRILRALVPKKKGEAVALLLLVPSLVYTVNKFIAPDIPVAKVWTETVYPKEVISGSYFYLSFDLSWSRTCDVTAYRYVTPSDGIQYLASVDQRSVIADQEDRYIVRLPIESTYPLGPASIRSDFEFSCDWFSTYIRPMTLTGRTRNFTILKAVGAKIPEKGSQFKESTQ